MSWLADTMSRGHGGMTLVRGVIVGPGGARDPTEHSGGLASWLADICSPIVTRMLIVETGIGMGVSRDRRGLIVMLGMIAGLVRAQDSTEYSRLLMSRVADVCRLIVMRMLIVAG